MKLLKFIDYLAMKESSAYTRSRRAADAGLAPPIFRYSRSTPRPKSKKKKKKKK